jgi:oxalate---CoA ligase
LVGYVVATHIEADELQAYAAEYLPDYMVPASFMFLTELPITSNGKLNKAALPDPIINRQTYVPPRNEIEIAIAKIWQETLQLSQISVTDNFFELGGNSLLALKMFYRIKMDLGSNLPMASLLKAPSIEKLASKVKEAAAEEDWQPVVAIQSSGNRPPFFGIHGVNGNILFYLQLSAILGMDQPFYALQAQGLDGRVITRTTVEQMSAFYLDEIRRVQPHGPYFLGGYSFGGLAVYEIAQKLRAIGEEVALLVLFDTYNPAKPPRFISPWAKLIERIKDPDGVDFNRLAHFFASHTRGPLRSRILSWNEKIQRKSVGPRKNNKEAYKQIEVHLQTVYANAFFEYKPLPYQGKMTILRASQRPAGYEEVEDLGWKDLVSGGIEIRNVPGSHANLFSKENVSELAKQLQDCLDVARRTHGAGK